MDTTKKTTPATEFESPEEISKKSGKLLALSFKVFQLGLEDSIVEHKAALKEEVMQEITQNNMAPYYKYVCEHNKWNIDNALLEKMTAENKKTIDEFDASIADAKESLGDLEVSETTQRKARYLFSIGDKQGAIDAYNSIPEKSLSTGQRVDVAMSLCRLGFFYGDNELITTNLVTAKTLNDQGGDWDRRNRLKVYEGLHKMSQRVFEDAAPLLIDSIATFTAIELISFERFVFYAVIVGLKSLSRPDLRKKVIDSPDVLSVINELPPLSTCINSFYDCSYADFFVSLTKLSPVLARDRFLAIHKDWILREFRIAAYVQFLVAYKSVSLSFMAKCFGIHVAFLDNDLGRFIAIGRINAAIDAVSGTVESQHANRKTKQYQALLKEGDALLNKVQNLSRLIIE